MWNNQKQQKSVKQLAAFAQKYSIRGELTSVKTISLSMPISSEMHEKWKGPGKRHLMGYTVVSKTANINS